MPVLTSNNTASEIGDVLIISFTDSFKDLKSLDSVTDNITTETQTEYFKRELRWSYDGLSYSAWILGDTPILGTTAPNGTPWGATALSVIPIVDNCPELWFEVRYTRGGTGTTGILTLNSVDLNITYCTTELPEVPPMSVSCDNPNYCAGITVPCDDNLFSPYSSTNKMLCLLEQINSGITDMFGHCVKYFKTDAQARSRDVILKEYSLFDVVAIKEIKVMVPNNEFPEDDPMYSSYDMSFNEDFVIHITKEEFHCAFGYNRRPEEKDYLYFTVSDQMWEVSSAAIERSFMLDGSYYKVSLKKWNDKLNVMRGATAESIIDALTVNLDIFKDEVNDEFLQITKPLHYNTISTGAYDFIRSEINTLLEIADDDINNYWTIVAKYYYKLNTVPFDDLAVKYKTKSSITSTDNRSFTGWFVDKRTYPSGVTASTVPILDGYNVGTTSGIKINATYNLSTKVINGFQMVIGATTHSFNTSFPVLTNNKWYAYVFNVSNTHKELSFYLWEMKYDPILYNQSPQIKQTTDLKLIYSETKTGLSFNQSPSDTYYKLLGSTIGLTNLRIMDQTIEEDKQPVFLNRFVVKDTMHTLLVDNALPQLRYNRESIR